MERKDVYRLIDGERRYQDGLGDDRKRPSTEAHTVGDYVTMMSHYQVELARAWTLKAGDRQALEVMRKLAGIAVHCMEDHGAPPRGPRVDFSDIPALPIVVPTTSPFPLRPRESMSFPAGAYLSPFKLGKGSIKNLEGVHPDLSWVVQYAITITAQDFAVTDGVRTKEEQAENVRTGVSQTMKSKHLIQPSGFGHAVDLVPWINGKARWELLPCYKVMEALRRASWARECLLRWGGAWVPLYNETPLPAPEGLVAAYSLRKRTLGKPAFIDAAHYEMVA